jgi:hypothetical protein
MRLGAEDQKVAWAPPRWTTPHPLVTPACIVHNIRQQRKGRRRERRIGLNGARGARWAHKTQRPMQQRRPTTEPTSERGPPSFRGCIPSGGVGRRCTRAQRLVERVGVAGLVEVEHERARMSAHEHRSAAAQGEYPRSTASVPNHQRSCRATPKRLNTPWGPGIFHFKFAFAFLRASIVPQGFDVSLKMISASSISR